MAHCTTSPYNQRWFTLLYKDGSLQYTKMVPLTIQSKMAHLVLLHPVQTGILPKQAYDETFHSN